MLANMVCCRRGDLRQFRTARRSKKKERRRAGTLDGFADIPRGNETALMQVTSLAVCCEKSVLCCALRREYCAQLWPLFAVCCFA